jgi:hypothetical protein
MYPKSNVHLIWIFPAAIWIRKPCTKTTSYKKHLSGRDALLEKWLFLPEHQIGTFHVVYVISTHFSLLMINEEIAR